ncbi:hypothetical protein TNCV_4623181 [Trichonephila clavipes]|nr:hypothetical protein TNCV_4623181 [Trichonephila clavipes]
MEVSGSAFISPSPLGKQGGEGETSGVSRSQTPLLPTNISATCSKQEVLVPHPVLARNETRYDLSRELTQLDEDFLKHTVTIEEYCICQYDPEMEVGRIPILFSETRPDP